MRLPLPVPPPPPLAPCTRSLFDNAEAYAKGEAERIMGKAIHLGQERGAWRREDLVITTKIFFGVQVRKTRTRGRGRER
jgi:aryl-alcohol dehydrogenase-like predicted oxidoreductase